MTRAGGNGQTTVAIVGAGPAGTICAIQLARSGVDVTLLDATRTNYWQPVEILAPATVRLTRAHQLGDIAQWPASATCRGVLGLWSDTADFFDYNLYACDFGVAVDRQTFDISLKVRAEEHGVSILQQTKVTKVELCANQMWSLQYRNCAGQSETIGARLLVEATGRSARHLTGVENVRRHYDKLVALACPISLRKARDQIMLLEAVADGWWYSSCDAAGNGAIVFLTDVDLLPRGLRAREKVFAEQFSDTKLLRKQLPSLPANLQLQGIDSRTSCRTHLSAGPSIAIGDAAFSVDPLSGAGLRRCMESAQHAAIAALDYVSDGDLGALEIYTAWAFTDFDQWLQKKNAVYADACSRFENKPFWARRHGAVKEIDLRNNFEMPV